MESGHRVRGSDAHPGSLDRQLALPAAQPDRLEGRRAEAVSCQTCVQYLAVRHVARAVSEHQAPGHQAIKHPACFDVHPTHQDDSWGAGIQGLSEAHVHVTCSTANSRTSEGYGPSTRQGLRGSMLKVVAARFALDNDTCRAFERLMTHAWIRVVLRCATSS